MSLLAQTLERITPRARQRETTIRERWARHTRYGSYGAFPDMVAQFAAVTDTDAPVRPRRCMIIGVGDHGVVDLGVSAYPKIVTQMMCKNYLVPKGAAANALANYCGADVDVVDIGIDGDMGPLPGLRQWKVRNGTRNMLEEPAMTDEECRTAVERGIALVAELVEKGYRAFLVGEMGISNTTSAALMTAKFANLTAEEATGRGSNISDERLTVKQRVVRDALARYAHIAPTDGWEILRCMGGLEFALITGVLLGAAAHRCLVVIDGFNTTACTLVAHSLQPDTMDYIMASHLSAEKAHVRSLATLGLTSYVDLGFCLGEATGGSMQMQMLMHAIGIDTQLREEER